jgi:hypothetical protein
MDDTHEEFVTLLNQLLATPPDQQLPLLQTQMPLRCPGSPAPIPQHGPSRPLSQQNAQAQSTPVTLTI